MNKVIIEPGRNSWRLELRELVSYRDLFYVLAFRDFKVRYAQTFLGFAWTLLQPLATLLIFMFVFGKALDVKTGDIPYPIFAVSGMVAWTYFSFVLNNSGNSLIGSQEIIKKIYFPRLIIPISKGVVGLIDLVVGLLIIFALMVVYKFPVGPNVVFLPVIIAINIITSLGVGIWFCALSIRYRDVQHVIPFLVQFGLYATPVGYPASMVTSHLNETYTAVYYLNPLAGVIELFRWSMLGTPFNTHIYISILVGFILFVSGIFYFKRVDQVIADII